MSKLKDEVLITKGMTRQFIIAKIENELYGFDISSVDNVVRMQSIARVPKAQPYYMGVMNLRGEVIAVMSLRRKLNLSEDVITDASRILILNLGDQGCVGIMVDEVIGIAELAEENIDCRKRMIEGEKHSFIFGTGYHGDTYISLIDIHAVVGEAK